MNAYAYLSLVAIAVNLLVGVYVLSRGPKLLLNRLFFAVLMAIVAWATGEFIMRTVHTTQAALRGSRIAGFGWCFIGPLFVIAVLAFTEKERLLRKPRIYLALFAPGAFFLVMLWTTDLIFRGFVKSYWGYREIAGPLRLASQLYVALMFLIGLVLLFQFGRKTQSLQKRTDARFVLAAALIPVCTGLVTDIILPRFGIHVVELSVFASTAIGPLIGYAVINQGLLTSITGSLGSTIITKIREAVIVIDSDGLIETVNPAAEELTGYPHAELTGIPIARLFTSDPVMADAGEVDVWNTCISKSGELMPVSLSSESVRMRGSKVMGSVIVVHDLRETIRLIEAELEAEEASAEVAAERDRSETLLRSREELKELSAFLESVIENIAEPLWIKDRDFRFVFVNEAFCELSGFSREEIIGKTGHSLATVEQADEVRECDAEVFATGQMSEIETVLNDREGKAHLVRALRAPLKDDAGKVQYLVGIFTDITEQRQLENARLDFIRVAAHELRTPLTSLKLGFDVLARETRGVLDEEQRRSLDILSLSIERLSSLARNLLDLASIDAGLFTLKIERVEVEPMLEEAVTIFSSTISDKGLYCSIDAYGGLKPVYADSHRFSQVLYNLVSNAVKFTDAGGITISARNSGDDLLEICVADTGAGIPAELQESIFSSFVRPRDPDGREGTGLGLSITKAIVEAHGGRVWVQSRVGAGSKFFFTLRSADE